MNYQEILDERTLMRRAASKKSGTMPIPGSEGAARKDVSRAGFRRKGPIQKPEVEKSGTDVPIWVRTHKSPAEYAAHTAKQKHKEGDKTDVKSLRKQLHKTGATKDSEVHDITVGSPKSKVKDPGQRARQFVGALKTVAAKMKERKGVATNTPTAISSGGKKRKRSDEEGAEQRGRIYKKLGMGERDPKTGVQMAKLKEGKTFQEFLEEARQQTFSSRTEGEKHHGGTPSGYYWNNAGSTEKPKWRLKPKSGGVKERQARKERIQSLSSSEEREKAKRKERAIKRKGYEAHHITPTHHSSKLKSSMSDAEWKERVERDKKIGVYHGHHPRNLMAAKGKSTPKGKPGIQHRAGGAHEVEGKVKDIVSGPGSKESAISHRDLLAAAVRKQRRKAKKNK